MSQSPSWKHLLLYDGVCVLCNRLTGFVLQNDKKELFGFAPLQSEFAQKILTKNGHSSTVLDTFYCVSNYGTPQQKLLDKSSAALFLLTNLGGIWSFAAPFKLVPKSVLNLLYDQIASNRYNLFGRTDACLMPEERWKSRFIE